MLCVAIKGPTFEEAHQQLSMAITLADLVELRLDCFDNLNLSSLERLCSDFSIPMIFTLRSQQQGGSYQESEEKRLEMIRHLLQLKPHYFDLESHVDPRTIRELSSQFPESKLILSYHNFTKTPQDLERIYQKMKKMPATYYKIAVTAQNSLDALHLLCWAKQCNDSKLIAISMGLYGQVSRILAPVISSPITYAALEEGQTSAPGQLSAKTLIECYGHKEAMSINR